MMLIFRNNSTNLSGRTGGWNTFSSQFEGASKIKFKKSFLCFSIHSQASISEVLSILNAFQKQVQGFFRQNWWIWNIFWHTILKPKNNFGNERQGTFQWELDNFGIIWIESPTLYWGSSGIKRMLLAYKLNFYIKQNWFEFQFLILDKDAQGFIQVEWINTAVLR